MGGGLSLGNSNPENPSISCVESTQETFRLALKQLKHERGSFLDSFRKDLIIKHAEEEDCMLANLSEDPEYSQEPSNNRTSLLHLHPSDSGNNLSGSTQDKSSADISMNSSMSVHPAMSPTSSGANLLLSTMPESQAAQNQNTQAPESNDERIFIVNDQMKMNPVAETSMPNPLSMRSLPRYKLLEEYPHQFVIANNSYNFDLARKIVHEHISHCANVRIITPMQRLDLQGSHHIIGLLEAASKTFSDRKSELSSLQFGRDDRGKAFISYKLLVSSLVKNDIILPGYLSKTVNDWFKADHGFENPVTSEQRNELLLFDKNKSIRIDFAHSIKLHIDEYTRKVDIYEVRTKVANVQLQPIASLA
jgi:hypothetical protein